MSIRGYQDLIVWQQAIDLVECVYQETRQWPQEERYGLIGQVRRAAISVPANIAEGQGRRGNKEFLHHLSIATGSLYEVQTYLTIAQRLHYLEANTGARMSAQAVEIAKLLHGLIRKLQSLSNSE